MRMAGQGLQQLTGLGSLDYGVISEAGMKGRANERIMGHEAAAQTHGYGLQALASIGAAEAQAEAAIAQGQAAGQSAMVSGLFSGIGSIASGAIKGRGAGGSSSNYIPGVAGQDSTTHYGWNAPASQYEPGAISKPGWTWDDL